MPTAAAADIFRKVRLLSLWDMVPSPFVAGPLPATGAAGTKKAAPSVSA